MSNRERLSAAIQRAADGGNPICQPAGATKGVIPVTLPATRPVARRVPTPTLVARYRNLARAHRVLTNSGRDDVAERLAEYERAMTDLTRTLCCTHRREIADGLVEERRLAEGPVGAGTAARLELLSETLSTAA